MINPQPSKTYKFRTLTSDKALYFTIVGDPDPIAFFINSKEMKSFQWISALMISYTRMYLSGVSIESIIEDMKLTFDPKGKYFIDGSGKEVNSLVHHLGLIIETHITQSKL